MSDELPIADVTLVRGRVSELLARLELPLLPPHAPTRRRRAAPGP